MKLASMKLASMKLASMKLAFGYVVACIAAALVASPTSAAITAFTSFENETAVGGNYVDPTTGSVSHDLINISGQPVVDSTLAGSGAAGDLGFNARLETIGPFSGLTDGDEVGVTNNALLVGAFSHGNQGYVFDDTDGYMILEFAPVDITTPTTFGIDYFVLETGWESNDSFEIFLTIDGITTVDIIDTTGGDIDDLAIEGKWTTGSADLTGLGASAVLTVRFLSGSAGEGAVIDNVTFSAVPEPASLALVALATLPLVATRRLRRS